MEDWGTRDFPGVASRPRAKQAEFAMKPAERILPGDEVCIDTSTGLLRKAKAGDKWTFLVPEDAWQEGDKLCIPPNAVLPRLRQ
jgi:hypothetical protein